MITLEKILRERRCFKLVCGAGNEDPVEVERLVAVYAKAGANYFDLSASKDVVLAAKRGIELAITKNKQRECFLNVSVGIAGDPHVRKAFIDKQKCQECGACVPACLQKAIQKKDGNYFVAQERCIGCGACEKVCPAKAINFIKENKDFREVLPPLIALGLDSIELHASTPNEEEALNQWQTINSLFDGILSLCIDRSHLGDVGFIGRIKGAISGRKDFTTIIQADGAPMSGANDDYNTTLQAIAAADIVQKANLPVWLLLSGGTNSKTTEMAKLFGVHAHGVAIGSFARKIVKPHIEQHDFFENKKVFQEALLKAKWLVDKSLKHMK